ncbi:membrane protein insertion efficiency factor YidD [Pseudonocardia abyssalis]|uniref:Membrane protein insertion efficiency factor YidD n=1 Tax=Pseudonocardia abyssalis TaxID=2792008 RepID=A0ABS6UT76_9PSEU|nr:membrane protein insertion efficiency factor YidD [Pseudonocardia abyssalis]MBW0135392.1 membrane protein insertion efficiency factor YidD [Pseudonocardia abyssalis]
MRRGPGEETPAERRRRREEEERHRRQEEARKRREDVGDALDGAADVGEAGSGFEVPVGGGRGSGRTSGGRADGTSSWGCDGWGGGGGSRGSGSSGISGSSGGRSGGSGCDGCDGCDCNLTLLSLTRLSTLLLLAAAVLPDIGGGAVVRLIRFYRRRLTSLTPRCPSTPSCSAYALAVVEERGVRRGLVLAARRVRECGR